MMDRGRNLQSGADRRECLGIMNNEFVGWCGQPLPADARNIPTTRQHSFKSEAPGYIAMLAFLCAYLLSVVEAGHFIQAALNLIGASVGAVYLRKKDAIPSVISNLAWAAITIAGVILGS